MEADHLNLRIWTFQEISFLVIINLTMPGNAFLYVLMRSGRGGKRERETKHGGRWLCSECSVGLQLKDRNHL